ncbi:MAG: FHA domain-containing protein [Armatimonadetes bacterium]|nr:FHA domain-containing protein [Armatimonadota bacterium]
MRPWIKRVLLFALLGACSGALAAWIAYEVRGPVNIGDTFGDLDLKISVDDVTLSDEPWAITAFILLGALVCGSIAVAYVSRKGARRMLQAVAVAAPLGALGCWGSRWLMDQMIYSIADARYGTREISLLELTSVTFFPGLVWQVGVALGLTMPVVLAIGLSRFTLLRGLLGSVFVIVFGQIIGVVVALLVVILIVGMMFGGTTPSGDASGYLRFVDVLYLFNLGLGAGIAFAVAEAVYKPVWLKSFRGQTEGRTWALQGAISRIGSQEGIEVLLPADGTIAPVHAQIQAGEDAHYIVDLAGDLKVNGQPVQTQWLNDGDQIGVGSAMLLFRTRLQGQKKGKEVPQTVAMSPAPIQMPVLIDAVGNEHVLHNGVNVVGRDIGCDIAMTWERGISRTHAELIVDQNGVTVKDRGSTNGTFVDGERLQAPTVLAPGQTVTFGKVACKLKQNRLA